MSLPKMMVAGQVTEVAVEMGNVGSSAFVFTVDPTAYLDGLYVERETWRA